MRTRIMLRCTECNEENYLSSKNKKNVPDRLELKKYCPRCNKNTLHREKR
ncbi:MAG: 50S ribosomal protein L33 [Erysipelotrichaceae bacterium]|jgi:large subunit ribosomal protein L33|nr:50S ribosomal protein L33 [Bacillota bacterium]MDY0118257.1 50S ribosomal protein L33 [Bacilli bacterium]NLJ32858.1 50S ribosomal protein L33 [Erysipelotrichaceae bacterium]HOF65063.1 50S ribosomal protein L33 [Bacilli bacterium]